MNRKNTILIAICINAGLLMVLMVSAITSYEEVPSSPEQIVQMPQPLFDEPPPFEELKPLTLAVEEEPKKPEIVHQLPKVVEEKQIAKKEKKLPKTLARLDEILVKKGDNLEKIARAHQTTVDEIIRINHLPNTFLKIGQRLKIPHTAMSLKGKSLEKQLNSPEYYTIKVGENPWAIAMRHHMKLDELLKLNGLNEEKARKLRPGDRLRIR